MSINLEEISSLNGSNADSRLNSTLLTGRPFPKTIHLTSVSRMTICLKGLPSDWKWPTTPATATPSANDLIITYVTVL
jgi:hypothetical protein